jgi:AraC-like DNA-binding protein
MKKKEKVELRYYDIPQKEGVLALLGENWVRSYGDGIDYPHFHNLLEIGVCRSGTGELVLDSRIVPYGPDMISVIPKNYPHTTNSTPGTESAWEYLFLEPGMLMKEYYGENEAAFRRFLELTGREALFAGTREYPQLAGIVDAIMDEMRVKKSFYVEKVRGLLTALLFEIARITEREAAPHVPDSRVFGQISKALRYVDRHYAEPVRIGDLAEACSISETHFRRLFYEYIHMTPVEYLNMVRVLHACEILRSSNDTIAGVAVRCGFSTVSTLDRNFRQVLGVTPGQWKRDPKNYESKLLEVNVSVRKGW